MRHQIYATIQFMTSKNAENMIDFSIASLKELIPSSSKGKNVELEEHCLSSDEQQSAELFKNAVNKLLYPPLWKNAAGSASAAFKVWNDVKGTGKIQEGSIIRIDIPGPGSPNGGGYDWVVVDRVVEGQDDRTDHPSAGILLKATTDPETKDNETAHFFEHGATSTLIVQKQGLNVYAAYYGRNEKPNTNTGSTVTNIRNGLVAIGAMIGISEIQWSSLLKGLLDYKS